jgi:hypothetical protein
MRTKGAAAATATDWYVSECGYTYWLLIFNKSPNNPKLPANILNSDRGDLHDDEVGDPIILLKIKLVCIRVWVHLLAVDF